MFKCSHGLEWHPRFSLRVLERFENDTGCSLFEQKTIDEIRDSKRVGKLLRLAFFACESECKERGINFEMFADAIGNMDQANAMTVSTLEALSRFFPKPSQEAPK
jgi:hypothetical protein